MPLEIHKSSTVKPRLSVVSLTKISYVKMPPIPISRSATVPEHIFP